jgi:hypothetical protein
MICSLHKEKVQLLLSLLQQQEENASGKILINR